MIRIGGQVLKSYGRLCWTSAVVKSSVTLQKISFPPSRTSIIALRSLSSQPEDTNLLKKAVLAGCNGEADESADVSSNHIEISNDRMDNDADKPSSLDSLLNKFTDSNAEFSNAKGAVDVLKQLCDNHENWYVEFKDDKRVANMINVLKSQHLNSVKTPLLLNLLTILEDPRFGVPEDAMLLRAFENALIWKARLASMSDLVKMLGYVHTRREKGLQKKLYKEVITVIERRWVEVMEGKLFIGILQYQEHFSDGLMKKIQDRVMEMAELLDPPALVMILSYMRDSKQRSIPVLKNICYHLAKDAKELNCKQIANALYTLNSVSFKDYATINALCNGIKLDENENIAVVRSILISMGKLKYQNIDLLDYITKWMSSKIEELSEKDLLNYLFTTSTLNYIPEKSDLIFEEIKRKVSYESLQNSNKQGVELIWLNVVWSLALLNKQTVDQISSILTKEFCNKLLYSHFYKNIVVVLKILNINAVASHLTPNYSGPKLDVENDSLLRDVRVGTSVSKSELVKEVTDAFANIAAPNTMSRLSVNTGMGLVNDIECAFDSNLKPVCTKSLNGLQPNSNSAGHTKLAVLVLSFNECLSNGALTGLNALKKRLLQANGYKVLFVTYMDIKSCQKKLELVKRLELKVKQLLQNG